MHVAEEDARGGAGETAPGVPQRLKPRSFGGFAARLKPCP